MYRYFNIGVHIEKRFEYCFFFIIRLSLSSMAADTYSIMLFLKSIINL